MACIGNPDVNIANVVLKDTYVHAPLVGGGSGGAVGRYLRGRIIVTFAAGGHTGGLQHNKSLKKDPADINKLYAQIGDMSLSGASAYINGFRQQDIPENYKVGTYDYHWSLNVW